MTNPVDVDEVLADMKKRPGQVCKLVDSLAQFEEKDSAGAAKLREAVKDERYSGIALTRALARLGIFVGKETVNLHRRGDCACNRKAV